MITIKKNGKFIIPEKEVFIGYAGDNLHATKEFFVEGVTDVSLIYRMYLQFDDGSTNFFLLDSKPAESGTKLTWNVTSEQIYKSGILKMQIKASNSSGIVFHSAVTSLLVHTSIEFGEAYKNKENSEFLQHEEYLNGLLDKERAALEDINERIAAITEGTLLDAEPVENSNKAVKSGGIYNALKKKLNDTDGAVKLSNLSEEVKSKISAAILYAGTGAPMYLNELDKINLENRKIYIALLTTNQLFLGSETQYCYIVKPSDRRQIILGEIDGLFFRRGSDEGWSTPERYYYPTQKVNQFLDLLEESFDENIQNLQNGKLDNAPNSVSYDNLNSDLRTLLSDLQNQGGGEAVSGLSVYAESISKSYSGTYMPITLNELDYVANEKYSKSYDSSTVGGSGYGFEYINIDDLQISADTKYRLTVTRTGGTREVHIKFMSSTNSSNSEYIVKQFSAFTDSKWTDTVEFSLSSEEFSKIKTMLINTATNEEGTYAKINIQIDEISPREWQSRKIYSATMDKSVFNTENPYRILIFNLPNRNGRNQGVYNQVAIGQDGVVWHRNREESDFADWSAFTSENIVDEFKGNAQPSNFSGKYELSANKVTVYGSITISDTYNSDRITFSSGYIPTHPAYVIGGGLSSANKKHYIVEIISSAPYMEFKVLNMDGTKPTGSDTIQFTATVLRQ